jgi:hypothetical protein
VKPRTRHLSLIAASTVALALTGQPSASASCLELDAACRADGTIGAGQQLLDDMTEPVDTPLDGTLDPIVEDAFDRAHDVLAGDPIDLPDPIDGGGGGGGGYGGTDLQPPGSPTPGGPGAVGGRSPDGPGPIGPLETIVSPASGIAPSDHVDRSFGERFGEALGGLVRSLAIVLAMLGLAVAFVAIQDRLDRNDPRLALAPVDSDVVRFA